MSNVFEMSLSVQLRVAVNDKHAGHVITTSSNLVLGKETRNHPVMKLDELIEPDINDSGQRLYIH